MVRKLLLALLLCIPVAAHAQARFTVVLPKDSIHANGDTATWFVRLRRDGADSMRARGNRQWVFYAPIELLDSTEVFLKENVLLQPDVATRAKLPLRDSITHTFDVASWGLDYTHADSVWAMGITGTGVIAGSADTGASSSDLPIIGCRDMTGTTPINQCSDIENHGTHTAGTIAGKITGMAPGASLFIMRVFENDACCGTLSWSSSQMAAIQLADSTLHTANPIRLLAMSLGGPGQSTGYKYLVSQYRADGGNFYAAAGNDGNTTLNYPAAYDSVKSISSCDPNGAISGYSDRGPKIFLCAPGSNIYSTVPGGYGTMSGTSMAQPHVTGAAALVLSFIPLTPNTLDALLCASAADLEASGRDDDTGCGMVRPDRAIYALQHPLQVNTDSAQANIIINISRGETDSVFVPTNANWAGWADAAWAHTTRRGNYLIITVDTIATLGMHSVIKFGTVPN